MLPKCAEKRGYQEVVTGFVRRLNYGGIMFARQFRRGQKGFTLIELLVVVAIL
jgi:type II secretory pathway component PulJ